MSVREDRIRILFYDQQDGTDFIKKHHVDSCRRLKSNKEVTWFPILYILLKSKIDGFLRH